MLVWEGDSLGEGSKRKGPASLWPNRLQTWFRIGLPAVRQMLVKHARIDLPTFVDLIRHADAGQNVEREILPLRPTHVRVTVDPTETEPARNVRNDPPVRPDKIVTAAEIHAKVMVLHPAKDRLCHQGETKLIVAASPVFAVIDAPANPPGNKFRPDLVTIGIAEDAEQVA